jgi:hypothetical protein
MRTATFQRNAQRHRSWLGIGFLILFALLYCSSALTSPFWSDNDTWSNLLPVIHFRQSILEEHTLPLYTDLWYGGRAQWANPLWNFFYLPSTIVWLVFPLDWGTRIIFLGHLIFSLLTGRALTGLFLKSEMENVAGAILFTSPILPALGAGHVEKVMSWGWVLLACYFLFNMNLSSMQRGLAAGVSLGIVPLTGSNYYTFYAVILLLPLVISFRDVKLFYSFALASLIGLIHLISIWQMIGSHRAHAKMYIDAYSVNVWGSVMALSTGFSDPLSWETWSPIGIPMLCLFSLFLVKNVLAVFSKEKIQTSIQEIAVLISGLILLLLATGVAYQYVSWLDLFRVPARALAFVALAILIFILINAQAMIESSAVKRQILRLVLLISAVQVVASSWFIRPEGSLHSPYEASVHRLVEVLKADSAKRVWISTRNLDDMYIHVGLTANQLALPNVYYGDLGQVIQLSGNYCGYSFDHLIVFAPVDKDPIQLRADAEWSNTSGEIPLESLSLLQQVKVDDKKLNVYRVICN